MKKLVALALCLALCLALAACGGSEKQTAGSADAENSAAPAVPADGEWADELGNATEQAYEVVSAKAEVYTVRGDTAHVRVVFGVRNLSPYPMASSAFARANLSTADGAFSDSVYMDGASALAAQPGETVYYFAYYSGTGLTEDTELTVEPVLSDLRLWMDGEQVEDFYRFFDAQDAAFTLDEDGTWLHVRAQFTNDSDAAVMPLGAIVFYDESGNVINGALLGLDLLGDVSRVQPGDSAEIVGAVESYGTFTEADFADYDIYVYIQIGV